MSPHLVKWHEKYSSEGLTVIEIIDGSIDPLDRVRQHVRSSRVPFAVLHDADSISTTLYGVQSFPTSYLINRAGDVVWEGQGFSARDLPVIEREIQKALGK